MNKVKILLYCTKGKPYLYKTNFVRIEDLKKGISDKLVYEIDTNERLYLDGSKRENLNGKIVAEFECDKVEEIFYNGCWDFYFVVNSIASKCFDNDLACLSVNELENYLGNKKGYALHLSNVEVFDKPKELDEYYIFKGNYKDINNCKPNKNAPQNMKNVYEFCSSSDKLLPKRTFNKCILISIQPQHLVNILNGKKTIEVRRKIISPLKNLMGY